LLGIRDAGPDAREADVVEFDRGSVLRMGLGIRRWHPAHRAALGLGDVMHPARWGAVAVRHALTVAAVRWDVNRYGYSALFA